jgi:hypothetical protein
MEVVKVFTNGFGKLGLTHFFFATQPAGEYVTSYSPKRQDAQ